MQNFVETCSLVLSDNDISTSDTPATFSVPNAFGVTNSTRSDRTWWNVDLKEVVGEELYRDYQYFNLRLNAIVYLAPGSSWGSTNSDRTINIFMEGPEFINNTYDASLKMNTNSACIGNFILQQGTASQGQIYDSTWLTTFYRPSNTPIRIYFQKIDKSSFNLGTATSFPRFTFYFSIFPVK